MKKILTSLAGLGLAALVMAGCSSSPTETTVNVYLQFKQGDQWTYNYYQRDSLNARIDGSKEVRRWTVLKTDTTVDGRNGASMIQQVRFDATGNTELGRDTLFLQSSGEGKVYQYDVVGDIVELIPLVGTYADSISSEWVQVGNTKITGTATWASFVGDITVANIPVPVGATTIPMNMILTMNAYHKGKQSIVVPAGTFTENFKTDHAVHVVATALGATVANDSVMAQYNIDPKVGIVQTSAASKTIVAQAGTSTIPLAVPGFEMELVSYTRAQ